jgi:hypothetical protein
MTNKIFIPTLIISFLFLCACEDGDTKTSRAGKGILVDHGFIPTSAHSGTETAEFQSAIYNDGHVFIATSDGIWKNNLSTKKWTRSGLAGRIVTALYKHPIIHNKFFVGIESNGDPEDKTIFISTDGGVTWNASETVIFDGLSKKYEKYACFAIPINQPNHVYANLEGGTTIAVSTDGGQNWVRMNNEAYSNFTYQSVIAFLPSEPNVIYQGSEAPLDISWLGKYDIDPINPVVLSGFEKVINEGNWGNRRPTELLTFPNTPGELFVGQEGALSKISRGENKFIFRKEDGNFPYPYIYAIWVDIKDKTHLLFGGSDNNSEQEMQLYETYHEGISVVRIENKMNLENPEVREIINTETYPAILLNDKNTNKVKLVLYHY